MSPRVARYREIERWLAESCASLPAGSQLPSETELAARFGVSRMTARQAVNNLQSAGLVERRRGSGTFVSTPPIHRKDRILLSFTEDMRRRGMRASSRLLSATVAASPENASALGLAPTAWLVCIDRVRLADDVPLARERTFLPGEFRRVLEYDLERGSLHAALTDMGVAIHGARGYLQARLAGPEETELLELTPPAVLLVERRTVKDDAGRPIENTETAYAGSHWVIDTGAVTDPGAANGPAASA